MSTTSVPGLLRRQVDRWAETWLNAKFSRLLELRAENPGPFNYPIAVEPESAQSHTVPSILSARAPGRAVLRTRARGLRRLLGHLLLSHDDSAACYSRAGASSCR
jgi:hypothetical protein